MHKIGSIYTCNKRINCIPPNPHKQVDLKTMFHRLPHQGSKVFHCSELKPLKMLKLPSWQSGILRTISEHLVCPSLQGIVILPEMWRKSIIAVFTFKKKQKHLEVLFYSLRKYTNGDTHVIKQSARQEWYLKYMWEEWTWGSVEENITGDAVWKTPSHPSTARSKDPSTNKSAWNKCSLSFAPSSVSKCSVFFGSPVACTYIQISTTIV